MPAGRVLSIPETVQLDHFEHRTVLQTVETEHGPIKVVGSGFRLEHGGGSVDRPPATLGQHTDEILREAGYSAADIAEMRAARSSRALLTARSRRRRRQVAGLGRWIATNLGDAACEVGPCLRDLREPGRGLVGEIEMPLGFAEIDALHGLPRRRDTGARLVDPRLVGRGAAQLGEAARPRAIVAILVEALGIVGEQPLGLAQTARSRAPGRSRR